MFPAAYWVGGAMLVSLTLYALSGGADFGGGVWDLLASGRRARAQRETILDALAPIWEANHVWLIVVLVLLFVAFPQAFAAIGTVLHIPLTLMLIGIVLRGSAFVFRTYDLKGDPLQRRWGRVFAVASCLTPLMLGVVVGAISSGNIRMDPSTGQVVPEFFSSWLAPFPFALGVFVLTLFAFLAAVYLTVEAKDPALQEDFRTRALWSGAAVFAMAWICFLLAGSGAPNLRHGLSRTVWALPLHILIGVSALGAFWALWKRRFEAARILAAAQVALIVWGWGLSQFPFLVVPDLSLTNAAAPDSVLRPVLIALAAGTALLLPSFWYLYTVFKGRRR